MKIEILCTGDEILSGKTVNTNYSHMSRRLSENGFTVYWGTVVGDDRDSLKTAFHQAAERADAVIVNGGLGPTVDDLSQEVAAESAGVELELHQEWLDRIGAWYLSRGRKMPTNNHKQAMLPAGSEFIDNPIGTACGFALDINGARFFFTPGVPREMKRMLEEQILTRLQQMRGYEVITRVKRFHTFGIGESRADQMLTGVEEMAEDGSVKLGFQSHYPQLETKLTVQGDSEAVLDQKLAPLESAVRERLDNFIVAEDDQTIEGRVIESLKEARGSLSILEMHTGGSVVGRLLKAADPSDIRRGIVITDSEELIPLFDGHVNSHKNNDINNEMYSVQFALEAAARLRDQSGSSHAIAVLTRPVESGPSSEPGADIFIGITDGTNPASRTAHLPGQPGWIRLGATEMSLDCLRRYLHQLPVEQRIDFEQH